MSEEEKPKETLGAKAVSYLESVVTHKEAIRWLVGAFLAIGAYTQWLQRDTDQRIEARTSTLARDVKDLKDSQKEARAESQLARAEQASALERQASRLDRFEAKVDAKLDRILEAKFPAPAATTIQVGAPAAPALAPVTPPRRRQ